MSNEQFNELLKGPLNHPWIPFQFTRLVIALRVTLEAGGEAAEKALLDHCRQREIDDRQEMELSE